MRCNYVVDVGDEVEVKVVAVHNRHACHAQVIVVNCLCRKESTSVLRTPSSDTLGPFRRQSHELTALSPKQEDGQAPIPGSSCSGRCRN
mgnify:CR=1 FL=1